MKPLLKITLWIVNLSVLAHFAGGQDKPNEEKRNIPISQNKPADDKLPKAISFPDPVYPDDISAVDLDGDVRLYINVNKKGNVSVFDAFGPNAPCSDLKNSKTKAIRKAVVDAAEKAVFEVPMKDGEPVEKQLLIKFNVRPKRKLLDADTNSPNAKLVQGGIVNGKALRLPKPSYPHAARNERAGGPVQVQVLIGEDGDIISASAISGHKLLRDESVETACRAKFSVTKLEGRPVKVSGVITYNFIP